MGALRWIAAGAGATLAAPAFVQAAQFATLEEAAHRSFPEATALREQLVQATADDLHAMIASGGVPPRTALFRMRVALKGEQVLGVVVADAVVGKFELIDYAVAVDREGRIRGVEILSYRESHGQEIKLPAWREQFVGKSSTAHLRVGDDIANISGATLSCSHVTDGVRHLVTLLERLRASGRM